MKRLVWFTGSSGLDMDIDSVRHEYDPDKGVFPARIAYNVDYDRSGRVSRRKGWQYTAVADSCHSLFCDGGTALAVKGNALCVLDADMTLTPIRNVTLGAKMYYQQIGSRIFYQNGKENGFVLNNVSYSWALPTEAYGQKDSTTVLSPPPLGTILCYFNGRIYVVQQYAVWFSEAYNVKTFNLTRNYIAFESPITMFHAVQNGIWAGTKQRIAFLEGTGPENFKYRKKALDGVIEGTDIEVDCAKMGNSSIEGVGVLFANKSGAYLGTPDGRLVPLTERKLRLPNSLRGAGIFINDRYIFSLEP